MFAIKRFINEMAVKHIPLFGKSFRLYIEFILKRFFQIFIRVEHILRTHDLPSNVLIKMKGIPQTDRIDVEEIIVCNVSEIEIDFMASLKDSILNCADLLIFLSVLTPTRWAKKAHEDDNDGGNYQFLLHLIHLIYSDSNRRLKGNQVEYKGIADNYFRTHRFRELPGLNCRLDTVMNLI